MQVPLYTPLLMTKVARKEQKYNYGNFGGFVMHIDHSVAIRQIGDPPVSLHIAISQYISQVSQSTSTDKTVYIRSHVTVRQERDTQLHHTHPMGDHQVYRHICTYVSV